MSTEAFAITYVLLIAFDLDRDGWSLGQCASCKDFHIHDHYDGTYYEMHERDVDDLDDVWVVDEHETGFTWSEFYEEDFCDPCVQSSNEHASTIVRIEAPGGERESVRFGECEVMGGEYGEVPAWFEEIGFHGREWHRTDAWRGYHDTKFDNLTEVMNGWVTGDWDDVPWKRDFHRFGEALESGVHLPPVDLFVCLEPTSNVFSTACSIFARNGEEDELRAWFESLPFDVEKALG